MTYDLRTFIPQKEHVIVILDEKGIQETGKSKEELDALHEEVSRVYENIFHREQSPLTIISSSDDLISALDKVVSCQKDEFLSISVVAYRSLKELDAIATWFNHALKQKVEIKVSLMDQGRVVQVLFSVKN